MLGVPSCMLSVTVSVVTPAAGRRWWLTDGPSGMVWRRRMRPRRFCCFQRQGAPPLGWPGMNPRQMNSPPPT